MKKKKVGVLTFSDGRKYVHEDLLDVNLRYQKRLKEALEATGEVEVVTGEEIVWTSEIAQREGRRLAQAGVDMTICNFAIWTFPNLTAVATRFAPGPYLLFCNINPSEPGMVAMLANAGMMDQLGLTYERVWGDIEDPEVLERVMAFIRPASALSNLNGETYGLFGGRPLGMYTAVSDQTAWMSKFGVDVEHIEQYDIMRLSEEVDPDKVEHALQWLERYIGDIRYDGEILTPEKLKMQI